MEDVRNIETNEQAALQATEEAEKEQETAQAQVKVKVKEFPTVTDSDTKNIYNLSKPFEWEGKTYTKLNLDFERLTGVDMIAIENEMAAVGEYALSPEISTSYLSKLAARAAGVGNDVIEHMPIRDFAKVKNRSRDFLLSTGLAN